MKRLGLAKPAPAPVSPVIQANKAAFAAQAATVEDHDWATQLFEAAATKLEVAHEASPGAATYEVAERLRAWAEHFAQQMGAQRSGLGGGGRDASLVGRLHRVVDATDLILDQKRVEDTRAAAQHRYIVDAKRSRVLPQGFAKLSPDGKSSFADFDPSAVDAAAAAHGKVIEGLLEQDNRLEDDPDAAAGKTADALLEEKGAVENEDKAQGRSKEHTWKLLQAQRSRAFAAKMGLTDAERAAIQVYTGGDFTYINPATSGDKKWLGNATGGKDMSLTATEGATHAAIAIQGLRKLPAYAGQVYRAEGLSQERFDKWFEMPAPGATGSVPLSVKADNGPFAWGILTSTSKNPRVRYAFSGYEKYSIWWTIRSAAGRDVSTMSVNVVELEVLLLPNARVRIDQATFNTSSNRLELEATQIA